MPECETVKVVRKESESGYVVINKSDLKKDDVIYKEPAKKKAK